MHHVQLSAIDLNLLTVLERLLETRSVTVTARAVSLSQSATSHALSRLRVLFDDPLLVRRGMRLELTARAERLRVPLRSALDAVRAAVAGEGRFEPKASTRTFTLWTTDLGEHLVIPKLIAHARKAAPRMTFVVCPAATDDLERRLATGSIDVAIGPDGPRGRGIRRDALWVDSFVCAMRLNHPALRKTWDLDAYCRESHVVVAPRGTPTSGIDAWLASKGRTRHVGAWVASFLVAPSVVAASDLVWTAPQLAVQDLGAGHLVARPTPVKMPSLRSDLIWHAQFDDDPAHRWLREAIQRVFGEV